MKADYERVTKLLTDTVTLLCKNGLSFNQSLHVQGLLGITLDTAEVFLVSINEYSSLSGTPSSSAVSSSGRESAEPPRKRSREDVVDLTRLAETPDVRTLPASARLPPALSAASNIDVQTRSLAAPPPLQNVLQVRSQNPVNRMLPPPQVSPRNHPSSVSSSNLRQSGSVINRGGVLADQQSLVPVDSSRMMPAVEQNVLASQRVEQQQQMIIANSLQRLSGCVENNLSQQQQQMLQTQHAIQQQQSLNHRQQQQQQQQHQFQKQQHRQEQQLRQQQNQQHHEQQLRQQQQEQQLRQQQQNQQQQEHLLRQQHQEQMLRQQQQNQQHSALQLRQQQQSLQHQEQQLRQQVEQQRQLQLQKQHQSVRQVHPKQAMPQAAYPPSFDAFPRPSQQLIDDYSSHVNRPTIAHPSLAPSSNFHNYGMSGSRMSGQNPLGQICPPPSMDAIRMGHVARSPMLALPAPPGQFDNPNSRVTGAVPRPQILETSMFSPTNRPDLASSNIFPVGGAAHMSSRMQVPCISPADRALAAFNPGSINQHFPYSGAELPYHLSNAEARSSANSANCSASATLTSTVVKSSSSPTRQTHRTRPRVEHIDLCEDDSFEGTVDSVPASSILIQPDSIDISHDHAMEFAEQGHASSTAAANECSNSANFSLDSENFTFEADFDLPPIENIREILPESGESADDSSEEVASQSHRVAEPAENVESNCPSASIMAGFSDSGRSTGSDRGDLDELQSVDPISNTTDEYGLLSASADDDGEVGRARLSAAESQAIVELYFNSEVNDISSEPPTGDN